MTFCATHQCARTCPSYPRQRAVKKARSPEARALPGLWSVWADAHGVDLELEFEFEVEFKSRPFATALAKKSFVTTLGRKCSVM
jgi:hypothetical protein